MVEHAAAICAQRPAAGADVLNIGFGLGLIDDALQARPGGPPRSHTIVEAHPDVYARMIELGWDKKPGVVLLRGRWQDVLPQLMERQYDGVFFGAFVFWVSVVVAWLCCVVRCLLRVRAAGRTAGALRRLSCPQPAKPPPN